MKTKLLFHVKHLAPSLAITSVVVTVVVVAAVKCPKSRKHFFEIDKKIIGCRN